MAKKRRTPAQIRATKKLVALNKARSRGNPRRGGKLHNYDYATKNKLVIVNTARSGNGKAYMTKGGGSGRVISGYGSTVMNRGRNAKRNEGSGRVISGYGSTVMNGRRRSGGLTLAQGKRLYDLGKRSPKKAVAIKRTKTGYSIVTGKATRKLKGR